jgi:hypothetical protein
LAQREVGKVSVGDVKRRRTEALEPGESCVDLCVLLGQHPLDFGEGGFEGPRLIHGHLLLLSHSAASAIQLLGKWCG